MYIVTFSFDLGDYQAIYTGKIVGTFPGGHKVTYYEPTAKTFLSIDLPESEIIGKGHSASELLPLNPFIVDARNEPAAEQTPPKNYGVFTRPGFYGKVITSDLSTAY